MSDSILAEGDGDGDCMSGRQTANLSCRECKLAASACRSEYQKHCWKHGTSPKPRHMQHEACKGNF